MPDDTETLGDDIKTLIRDLSGPDSSLALVTADKVRLLCSALDPDAASDVQSLGILAVSKIASVGARAGGTKEEEAARIKRVFDPLVADAAAALGTDDDPAKLVPPTNVLAALAPLAPAGTVALLTQPLGLGKDTEDAADVDPLALLLEFAELPSPLQPALVGLLSGLAGTKAGRPLVRSRGLEWLTAASESDSVYGDTKVVSAVALSKLGREEPVLGEEDPDRAAKDKASERAEARLARTLMANITSSKAEDARAQLPTLEGLCVLSTRPFIRDILANDKVFLKALLALSPVPKPKGGSLPVTPRASVSSLDETATAPVSTALCYGIVTILAALTARKPMLTEQEEQMERLRRMALSGKKEEVVDPHESDAAADARTEKLYTAGVVSALRGIVRAESPRVREALGRLCCDLVEDTDDRLAFVRHGGVRVLTIILRDMKDPDGALPAAMALSKLVITTPPTLLFPPPVETNALNAVAPLCMQLTHPKTKLLNQFEALMGLTNLSSIGPDVSARIATAKVRPAAESNEFRGAGTEPPSDVRVMQRVEDMMLDDNHMVRRAATELVCNLVTSAPGFRYWSGEESAVGGKPDARACSRLSVLLLLSDVDDMPTRSAAAGALATLTDSGVACVALATGGGITSSRRRTPWQRIADLFAPGGVVPPDESSSLEVISNLPPDEGLAHRGAVVVVNMASYFRENDKAQFAAAQDALAATVDRAIRAFTPPKGQKTTEEREMILEVLRVAQQELA